MERLNALLTRITGHVNSELRDQGLDVAPYVRPLVSPDQVDKYYAFYGISSQHPLKLYFEHSSLAGSYFLGPCRISDSILYHADLRGDELKHKGDTFTHQGTAIVIREDESIQVQDSCLVRTLVHNFSHDPESLEAFTIAKTCAAPYANIHGAPTQGSFLGACSTVDLTTVHQSVIGHYAYVQTEGVARTTIPPGTVWIRSKDKFDFRYCFPADVLDRYIAHRPDQAPGGIMFDFMEEKEGAFLREFDQLPHDRRTGLPEGTSVDTHAVVSGANELQDNVLIAQRAYIENAYLGKGSNAQEHCYVIDSRLEGNNVTAHGAKIIHARLGHNVFVGFNSFLRGNTACPLTIGAGSIVMPHTIVDLSSPVTIAPETLIWGYITCAEDLATHSAPIETIARSNTRIERGNMVLEGDGAILIAALEARIHHILEANGAFFDGVGNAGHAQHHRRIAYSTIQPYPDGPLEGLFPTIEILP